MNSNIQKPLDKALSCEPPLAIISILHVLTYLLMFTPLERSTTLCHYFSWNKYYSTAPLALWIEIEMLQQWTDNDDDLETRTPSVILDILLSFSDSSSSSSLVMMRTTIMGTSAT